MKVGIYGGTFAPVHNGHISAAINFCRECKLDKLYIIPTFIPPHKEKKDTESCFDRLNMLNLAFSGVKVDGTDIVVSDYEIQKGIKDGGKSYTFITLEHFANLNDELFLLVGTDMFMSLETWKNPDRIFKLSTVVLMKRDENVSDDEINAKIDFYKNSYDGRTKVINGKIVKASSTEIRNLISRGSDVSEYVCKDVIKYINDKCLYKDLKSYADIIRNDLPLYLKEKRIPHVLAVEKEARKIASLLSLSERETDMLGCAALLHDITKKLEYDEQIAFLNERQIKYDNDFNLSAKTLHELTGAYLASEKYPEIVSKSVDNEIFSCILYHTTGNPVYDGSVYWKIIFISDFIEETRTYDECVSLRNYFYQKVDEVGCLNSIDETMLKALNTTISDLLCEDKYIHSWTVLSRNGALLYLKNKG